MPEDGILLPDGTIFRPGEGGQNDLLSAAAGPVDGEDHVRRLIKLAELSIGLAAERGVQTPAGKYHFEPGYDRLADGLLYLSYAVAEAKKGAAGTREARVRRRWAARHLVMAAAEMWGAERHQPEELRALAGRFHDEWTKS